MLALSVPKPKKKKTKTLSKQLDDLAGAIVRSRGYCEHCGRKDKLQWCHIVGRSARQVRWDLDNAYCLCHQCHFYFTNHPHTFYDFVGAERYAKLMLRANDFKKIDHKTKLLELNEYIINNRIET